MAISRWLASSFELTRGETSPTAIRGVDARHVIREKQKKKKT
jgi:hypothetical protein